MPKTVLITGATGLIGRYLTRKIISRGDNFIALTTDPVKAAKILPDAKKIVTLNNLNILAKEEIHAFINLAGSNLGARRWTESAKKDFYDSRIITTTKLVDLIAAMNKKPDVLVSASGVDYYGDTGSRVMSEDSKPANTFLGRLTHDWEQAAMKAEAYGTRVVVLRTGLVMAKDSDAIKKLLMPVRLFIGGPFGSGRQYVSWIHIEDLVNMYLYAIDNITLSGIYNASAPEPVTNGKFIRHAAKILHRPAIIPVPALMIKAATGEMSAVVLEGRKASADKITQTGFSFKFKNDTDVWKDILN